MSCPRCGTPTAKVHGHHGRTVAEVPVVGRRAVVRLGVRRLVCPVLGCRRQIFRERIPGPLERHARRTVRLTGQISGWQGSCAVVRPLDSPAFWSRRSPGVWLCACCGACGTATGVPPGSLSARSAVRPMTVWRISGRVWTWRRPATRGCDPQLAALAHRGQALFSRVRPRSRGRWCR
ncbi:transposase family protein [Streptomyces yaanensis]